MKITVLDGYTLNPGDLSWDALHRLGDCTIYDRTPDTEIIPRAHDADAILLNKTVITDKVLAQLPKLKYIGVLATGYNVVDLSACSAAGIPVTNVPEYGTESVAQMVLAHCLNVYTPVAQHHQSVRDGQWSDSTDWCYWLSPLQELQGKTLGLVGFGKIARAVAKLALAFGVNVIAYNRSTPNEIPKHVQMVALSSVFSDSDIVSLHCPLTEDNEEFVNAELLATMKSDAMLINTSRGPLINEQDLAQALTDGVIAAACLDVLSEEPPRHDNPLLQAPNCIITPHIAWATKAARQRLLDQAVTNVMSFIAGECQNVVNEIS